MLSRVREELARLEDTYGEDAYDRKELAALLDQLRKVPAGSAEYEEASALLRHVHAKQRIAYQAKSQDRPESPLPENAQHYGPMRVDRPEPVTAQKVEEAKAVKAGATRSELLAALGGCLVRQTWFRAQAGGVTTELYQVTPACRAKLGAKVFRVTGEVVAAIYDGDVDTVMAATELPPSSADSSPR